MALYKCCIIIIIIIITGSFPGFVASVDLSTQM